MSNFKNYSVYEDIHNPYFKQFLRLVRGSKLFFDVGAHVGLYSLPASLSMLNEGFVHAFEASSTSAMILRKHLEMNRINNCIVNSVFVGDCSDKVTFYQGPLNLGNRSGILKPKAFNSFAAIRVDSITLDEYCEQHQLCPDLIKIDVEGAELKVLKGAKKLLFYAQPKIILSLHLEQLIELGHRVEELSEIIDENEYQLWDSQGSEVTHFSSSEYLLSPRHARRAKK